MSLILDALKKSENERQSQGQPAMFEIRVAPPKARFPVWAVLVGLLLGVNLLVLLVVLVMRDPAAPPTPSSGPAPGAPAPTAAPAAAAATAVAAGTALPADLRAAVPAGAPTPVAPTSALASRFNPPLVEDPELGAEPADEPAGAVPVLPSAALPSATPARPGGGVVAGLPDRAALLAAGTQVPEVNVSLHAWNRDPAARFVFVDGARAGEGSVLPSGLRVEQITPDGTVLSWRGSRFLVPIQ